MLRRPVSGYTAGMSYLCGIDEAGRGPIAGPVTAAAVSFLDAAPLPQLRDSKQLTAAQRAEIECLIRQDYAFGIGWCWPAEIDRLNIHHATLLAMQRAYRSLARRAQPHGSAPFSSALIDGRFAPALPIPAHAVVGGDRTHPEIQAASILAKTARDRFMCAYAALDRRYGFERHKGYPTARHYHILEQLGSCLLHRRSFRGVS